MKDVVVDGMVISQNVVETIVTLAVADVEGVASIGQTGITDGIMSVLQAKPTMQGVEVDADEEGKLLVGVHIEVIYGSVLPDVADAVRQSVADAIALQLGVPVGGIDVFIDGMRFE